MRIERADSEVVVGGADGVVVDFGTWVRPHWTDMQLLARRMCDPGSAEDAVQEALTAAWRKRGQFDPARGTPRAWLLAVVADQARKQRRRRRMVVLLDHQTSVEGPEPAAVASTDLSAALQHLSERQRLAVSLFYYLDISVVETAQVMGCSVGTVKSTLADARARLQSVLGKEYR